HDETPSEGTPGGAACGGIHATTLPLGRAPPLTLRGGCGRSGSPMTPRYPGIARACFHLNWIFLTFWGLYLAGPDASGLLPIDRAGGIYALISGGLFAVHFVL